MKHRLLVLLCLLLPLANIHAAQSPPTEKQKNQPAPNTSASETQDSRPQNKVPEVSEAATRTDTPSGQKQRREVDIFQPSEEISEDFAVSFPVDI